MTSPCSLDEMPQEVILHVLSFLDLPDLASLSQVSSLLAQLASDPLLHKNRLRIVAPSRIQHSLFGQGPQGVALRPTIIDLVHRGVFKGLGIERRWRDGVYLYSQRSIIQYESSVKLTRTHAANVVNIHLRRRKNATEQGLLANLHQSHVLPDVESSSLRVSRTLLPVMRKLKWSFQRDRMARVFRDGTVCSSGVGSLEALSAFTQWLESRGKGVVQEDSERVRLALCPDIRKRVRYYEHLH
ncbi:hypothetical protein D9758_002218 [Tetrapyrgos nigripes]|uniref:F-box domain-containing protein n=1 Tax=Tetrapyrgos nigripes TaxID=182062 RepID=A0A8H5GP01_9AGAR|nr:hypothetical protein D9758_002218 [Tetrapyrgos nigripes]